MPIGKQKYRTQCKSTVTRMTHSLVLEFIYSLVIFTVTRLSRCERIKCFRPRHYFTSLLYDHRIYWINIISEVVFSIISEHIYHYSNIFSWSLILNVAQWWLRNERNDGGQEQPSHSKEDWYRGCRVRMNISGKLVHSLLSWNITGFVKKETKRNERNDRVSRI